ncbi:MAG: tetratricopeptide repeat protein [Pirellulales bacterium]
MRSWLPLVRALRGRGVAALLASSLLLGLALGTVTRPLCCRAQSGVEAAEAVTPAQLLQEAYQLSEQAETIDQYDQVIAMCEAASDAPLSPKLAEYAQKLLSWSYNRRGEMYAHDGNSQRAFADFDAAVALNPQRWQAWHNRGVSHALGGDYQAAIDDLTKSIELQPQYGNAYFNRAELLYELGEFQRAVGDYDKAIELNPADAAALNSRGHAYYRLGDLHRAVADYDRAIELEANDAATYVNRGDAYILMGRFARAANDFNRALQLDPQLARAYQSAAWLKATCPDSRFRNEAGALELARKAQQLAGEQDYRYLDTLAAAHANAGRFDDAVKVQYEVIQLVPEDQADRFKERLALYQAGQPYRLGGGEHVATQPRRLPQAR